MAGQLHAAIGKYGGVLEGSDALEYEGVWEQFLS